MSLPRAVDATKLASTRVKEILNVCDQIKSSDQARYGIQGLPRSLRRRTRSHNSYRHRKRPNNNKQKHSSEECNDGRFSNRRMRRKEIFRAYINPWSEAPENEQIFRLPTHIFHAKRMKMTEICGSSFIVPAGAFGRGRGTRSFHHKLNTSCIVHDASYWCSIELEGPTEEISSLLSEISRGSVDIRCPFNGERRIDGYNVGEGSKVSIGPIDVLWVENDGVSSLLVWAHCVYSRVFVKNIQDALKYKHLLRSVGRLGRIEIRGPESEEVLLKQGQGCRLDIGSIRSVPTGTRDICWLQKVSSRDEMQSSPDIASGCEVCEAALSLLGFLDKPDCSSASDLLCIRKDDGYSVIASRRTYNVLFKSICLSGSHITGQQEWHWYHTMKMQLFYPDDYCESPSFQSLVSSLNKKRPLERLSKLNTDVFSYSKMSSVLVWPTKNGTLDAGDVLCDFGNLDIPSSCGKLVVDTKRFTIGNEEFQMKHTGEIPCVGIISSAKPYAMHSKYCSIAMIDSKYKAFTGNKSTRIKLWAYSPQRRVVIPVTVKIC